MHADTQAIVERLRLHPHPEGGYYRETFRAPLKVGERDASTAIYFLLPGGAFSAFHRVSSDEVWHHYDGDPIDLHLIEPSGAYRLERLGHALESGEQPQVVIPAGVWQAAEPKGDRHALCGCTVAPGFDFKDFEMPARSVLLALFPSHAELLQRLCRQVG
jgi:uncharacterized protein